MDDAPNIDVKAGERGRLVYDKTRRTIVAENLPCPICGGVEGCDHTVPERAEAARAGMECSSSMQRDLRELCALLGLPDAPQPKSPHEVFRRCIDAAAMLLLARDDMLRALDRAWVFLSAICGQDGEHADEQAIIAEIRAVLARANGTA